MRRALFRRCTMSILLAVSLASGIAMAQPARPPMNPLASLKSALESSGAAALTSAQESSIQTLLTEFRNNHLREEPNASLQGARTAYEEAILGGDSGAAAAQAVVIAIAQSEQMVQRESDLADFAINMVAILKTGDGQLAALTTQLGTSGAVRLLTSLAGGPGRGFGPRPDGPDGPAPAF